MGESRPGILIRALTSGDPICRCQAPGPLRPEETSPCAFRSLGREQLPSAARAESSAPVLFMAPSEHCFSFALPCRRLTVSRFSDRPAKRQVQAKETQAINMRRANVCSIAIKGAPCGMPYIEPYTNSMGEILPGINVRAQATPTTDIIALSVVLCGKFNRRAHYPPSRSVARDAMPSLAQSAAPGPPAGTTGETEELDQTMPPRQPAFLAAYGPTPTA